MPCVYFFYSVDVSHRPGYKLRCSNNGFCLVCWPGFVKCDWDECKCSDQVLPFYLCILCQILSDKFLKKFLNSFVTKCFLTALMWRENGRKCTFCLKKPTKKTKQKTITKQYCAWFKRPINYMPCKPFQKNKTKLNMRFFLFCLTMTSFGHKGAPYYHCRDKLTYSAKRAAVGCALLLVTCYKA